MSSFCIAAPPTNDEPQAAISLTQTSNFCSTDAAYTNIDATPSQLVTPQNWTSTGNDVWFKFTCTAYDVNITVSGNTTGGGSTAGTLQSPLIAMYASSNGTSFTAVTGSLTKGASVSSYYKGGLTVGQVYYIRISAESNQTGTFKLCIDNYFPPVTAGQDCATATLLCNKQSFTQKNVVGPGVDRNETAGSCLGTESNSVVYKWQAANNGSLTFVITPTVNTDDIDFVLFDLGTANDCNTKTVLRCSAGHGVSRSCATDELFFKTGLSMTETDLSEAGGGCQGQNGFVQFLQMQQGHYYALLIDNFSSGNNGFTLEFGGDGEFVGPKSEFELKTGSACDGNGFVFVNKSTNYSALKWSFGEGASPATATGNGPFVVNYSTRGTKTALLIAESSNGCPSAFTYTFDVNITPDKPVINSNKTKPCLGETITLSTPQQPYLTYQWQGPNGFTATGTSIQVTVDDYNNTLPYTLKAYSGTCEGPAAQITLPKIGKTPVPGFTVTPNNECTEQHSYTITNTSKDFQKLNWQFGADASTTSANTGGPFTLTYQTPGDKTIILNAEGDAGCTATYQFTFNVPEIPITPQPVTDKPRYCIGESMAISVAEQPNTTYAWSGPNGFTGTGATIHVPAENATLGEYTVIATLANCSKQASITTDASQLVKVPVPAFDVTPPMPSQLQSPTIVEFFNKTVNAETYTWDFGDGSISTEVNPKHRYQKAGIYNITLTATNQGLCTTPVQKGTIEIFDYIVLSIPNAFTPNDDGINDLFKISVTKTKSYYLRIFNRFGIKVFETRDLYTYWPGTFNGQPAPTGTYYYIVEGITLSNTPFSRSGYVTIIR